VAGFLDLKPELCGMPPCTHSQLLHMPGPHAAVHMNGLFQKGKGFHGCCCSTGTSALWEKKLPEVNPQGAREQHL